LDGAAPKRTESGASLVPEAILEGRLREAVERLNLGISPAELLDVVATEDLAFPGCPMCRAADRTAWRYLYGLLHEGVNNFRTRELLRKSGGLCREHLLLAVDVAARGPRQLGIAILTEFLLEDAASRVSRVGRRQVGRRRLSRWRPPLGLAGPWCLPGV